MKFVILRLLTHSELGMFHAYRKLGLEGSKQRAINFDWDVVDRVFPAASDSDRIPIVCRFYRTEKEISSVDQWLKRQDKNWRFEGNCPKSAHYSFVRPGCLFVMTIDSGQNPAVASWTVYPANHPVTTSIINHAESSRLASSAMIALHGQECPYTRSVIEKFDPNLFPSQEAPMSHQPVVDLSEMEPDPLGLFQILAAVGYELPSAVSDLVDNSIAAGATEINITFPEPNTNGRWLAITDNGKGMDLNKLASAMRVGHQRDYEANELGKFGFGLKGASWSQADRLTVVSQAENAQRCHLTWDREHLANVRKWDILSGPLSEWEEEVTAIPKTGTVVLLTKMRPPVEMPALKGIDPYSAEVGKMRRHLELVFHRFLAGEARGRALVTIKVNGTPLVPNDPVGHPLTMPFDEKSIEIPSPKAPNGKGFLRLQSFVTPSEEDIKQYHQEEGPEGVSEAINRITLGRRRNETQGLFVYRLDRLIQWGGWAEIFALEEKAKLLRVVLEFDRNLDDPLRVNISKQSVTLPLVVKDAIKLLVKEPRAEARSRYNTEKRRTKKPVTPPVPPSPSPKPEPSPDPVDPPGSSGGAPAPTPKPKVKKPVTPPLPVGPSIDIRLIETDTQTVWQFKDGFLGNTLEINKSACHPLTALVGAIGSNHDAQAALADFLRDLDQAGIQQKLIKSSS
ncbi:MAG: hypothetical protein ACD_74C00109G0002 [uncultured bacterium]|nr:MAG: hypothetical protein ACD_74C00109G0002 [uncultured bacterium]